MSVPSININVACQACHTENTLPQVTGSAAGIPSTVGNPTEHESLMQRFCSSCIALTKDLHSTKTLTTSDGEGVNPVISNLRRRNFSGESNSSLHSTTNRMGDTTGQQAKDELTESDHGQVEGITLTESGSGNVIKKANVGDARMMESNQGAMADIDDDTDSGGPTDTDTDVQTIDAQPGFPYAEVSEYVGPVGKTINIGGCSVTFQPGCFEKTQKVTASVSINPDTRPHGKVGITPTLHVKAHDMKVPAIVKMSTWCVDDDNEDLLVRVLRFDEDEEDWDIVHSCPLGQSREIEFQVSHFSKFLAFLRKLFGPSYAVRPIVCFGNDQFAIATVLDDKTAKQYCKNKLKKRIGKDATINSYNPFHCKYSTTIRCRIFSKHYESDFTFTPTEVEHTVERVYQCRGSVISYLILESKKKPTGVTLSFHVYANKTRLENQAFKYVWQPVKELPGSEQTESNFPGNSARNFHANGDIHVHVDARKTTGTEIHGNGQMTSRNEGCSETISG